MDELKKKIDLKPLTDQQIKERSVSLTDLWMVRTESEEILGPFDTESLKTYTGNHQHLFENTQVYNLESEKWFETFKCVKSLDIIQDAGHCPHDEMPEKVNPILEKIIQEAI